MIHTTMPDTKATATFDDWMSEQTPKMQAFLRAKLDAMQAKAGAVRAFRTHHNGRAERWAVQAALRAVLRRRTGRKWAVVLKRTATDADFTVTWRAHWRRLPTPGQKERLAALLGKGWQGDCIGLTHTEAKAVLNAED